MLYVADFFVFNLILFAFLFQVSGYQLVGAYIMLSELANFL